MHAGKVRMLQSLFTVMREGERGKRNREATAYVCFMGLEKEERNRCRVC